MSSKEKTLGELQEQICNEIPYIDLKSYSHNIISITLSIIANRFGYNAANETIKECGLDELGWAPETECAIQEVLGTLDDMKATAKKNHHR